MKPLLTALVTLLLYKNNSVNALAKTKGNKKRITSTTKGFGAALNTAIYTPDKSKEVQTMVGVLNSQGANLKETECGFDLVTGRRGLYTKKNYKAKELICKIPSDCVLALADPAKKGEDAPNIAYNGLNFLNFYVNNPQMALAFKWYLDTLPTKVNQFDPTPDYFTSEEQEALEFPPILNKLKERCDQIETLAKEQNMKYEDLQFATWLASSRSFAISMADDDKSTKEDDDEGDNKNEFVNLNQKKICVLTPYLDLINHSSNPNAELDIIDPEKDEAWFGIRAKRSIPAGSEISISYGNLAYSSVDMLLNYGIVPLENNLDSYIMKKFGADGEYGRLSDWNTTLEEDEKELKENSELSLNMKTVLNFRRKMKESYE